MEINEIQMNNLLRKIYSVLKYCTLKKFDTSTDYGRQQERYRIISLSIIANLISKFLSLLTLVLTVSLTLPYLGSARFGVWMTIASLSAALTFLDLGIGNALTNRIAHACANGERPEVIKKTSGGIALLLLVSICITCVLYIICSVIDWRIFIKGIDDNILGEVQRAIKLFVVIFGISILSNGIQKIYMGMQKAYITYFLNSLLSLISIFCLIYYSSLHATIPVLILISSGIPLFTGMFLMILLIKDGFVSLNEIFHNMRNEAPHLISTGFFFFILQIGTLATWSGDNFIISSTLGVAFVAILSLTQRLFQISTVPLTIYNTPLWVAYADAHARKDTHFIKKTLLASFKIVGFSSLIMATFLILFGRDIISVWTGDKIDIPQSFIIAYAIWSIVDAVSNTLASFLNGLGIVKQQVFAVVSLVIISIPAKYFIVSHFGLTAMLSCFIAIYIVNYIVWYTISFKKCIYSQLSI